MRSIAISFSFWVFLCAFLCAGDLVLGQFVEGKPQTHLSGESYVYSMEYAGSQFYTDFWSEGEVWLQSGDHLSGQLLKYNIFTDDLIWLEPEGSRQVKLDKRLIKQFSLNHNSGNNQAFFTRWSGHNQHFLVPQNTFMQRLYQGNIVLLAHHKAINSNRTESVFIKGRGQQRILIIPSTSYYLVLPSEKMIGVRLNRRSLINILLKEYPHLEKRELRKKVDRITDLEDLIQNVIMIDSFIYKNK